MLTRPVDPSLWLASRQELEGYGFREGPPHPSTGLADLPEPRREYHLWRWSRWLDYDGLDEMVREVSPVPCPHVGSLAPLSGGHAQRTSVAGDDGRWHLLLDGQLACADSDGVHRRYLNGVFTDGTTVTRTTSPDLDDWTVVQAQWTVSVGGPQSDAALIEPRLRCPGGAARSSWPPYEGDDPAGRTKTALAAALGRDCHLCAQTVGAFTDHDHFTGAVRGLLCRPCNNAVDRCVHPAGCAYADYLRDPPAARLGLHYHRPLPKTDADLRQRIALSGIDPWRHLRRTPLTGL